MRVYPGRRRPTVEEISDGAFAVVTFVLAVILVLMMILHEENTPEVMAETRDHRTIVVEYETAEADPPEAIEAADEMVAPSEGILYADAVPVEVMETITVNAAKRHDVEYLGKFRTTGYCNCRRCAGKWAGGPTASGAMPVEGVTIATDPSVIPLGSRVMINGNVYTAQDTGSGIYGQRIDIYYEDHHRASNHGVQYAEVYLLK